MTRPLDGVTVLELGRVLAAPFAGMILAELGATVIKVEQPGQGDESRSFEPRVGDESAYYFACNRTKQSITANLRKAGGRDVVRRLAARADVLVENFPAGALAAHGLDQATLRAANDRLIYVSCTGFGQHGPYASRKGYDTIFQAMSGLMSLTGERGGPPVKPGLPIADLTSGLWIVIAVLAGLAGRTSTGRGGYVDYAMLDGQISLLTVAAARYFARGEIPPRLGTEHPGRVPSASFACRGGGWIHLTGSDQHWVPLCQVLGLTSLAERPDLATNEGRLAARDEVMAAFTTAIADRDRDELTLACEARGVPAGPLHDLAEILADPHMHARGLDATFEHPTVGRFRALPIPVSFDARPPRLEPPPRLGEHTEAVLKTWLDMSDDDLARLRAEGAV